MKGENQVDLLTLAVLISSSLLIRGVTLLLDINTTQLTTEMAVDILLDSLKHCILHT